MLFQLLASTAFSLTLPSLYKFITTPTTQPEELRCTDLEVCDCDFFYWQDILGICMYEVAYGSFYVSVWNI